MYSGFSYCDFIVFTEKSLHMERITVDQSFIDDKVVKVKHLFDVAILPELLGRWFSRPPGCTSVKHSELIEAGATASSSSTSHQPADTEGSPAAPTSNSPSCYCYCQQGEFGKMVGCDSA